MARSLHAFSDERRVGDLTSIFRCGVRLGDSGGARVAQLIKIVLLMPFSMVVRVCCWTDMPQNGPAMRVSSLFYAASYIVLVDFSPLWKVATGPQRL